MGWWIALVFAAATVILSVKLSFALDTARTLRTMLVQDEAERKSLREKLTRAEDARDQLLAKIEKAKGDLS